MTTPTLRVDDREALDLIRRMRGKISDMTEPMDEAGAIVHASVVKNFEVGGRYGQVGDWKGGSNRWTPLQDRTLVGRNSSFRKTKTGGGFRMKPEGKRKLGILQDRGGLRNSITWDPTPASVTIGTNKVYAAIQHLGGQTKPHVILPRRKKALAWPGGGPVAKVNHPGSEIPARPYLVIQDEDMVEIKKVFQMYLTKR